MAEPTAPRTPRGTTLRIVRSLRVAFSLLAVLFVVLGLLTFREAYSARHWIETSGTVISSKVNEFSANGKRSYTPLVVYAYSVDGDRYMSSRLALHQLTSARRGDAEAFTAAYPVGRTVRVYYNPENPGQAVLEPASGGWPKLLLGGLFAALALASRLAERKRRP